MNLIPTWLHCLNEFSEFLLPVPSYPRELLPDPYILPDSVKISENFYPAAACTIFSPGIPVIGIKLQSLSLFRVPSSP